MKAIYSRYGVVDSEEFDSYKLAESFLENTSNNCEGFPLGIFDEESKIYYHFKADVFGKDNDHQLDITIKDFEKIGVKPLKIEIVEMI